MNARRPLDAIHLTEILLRSIKNKGAVRRRRSHRREIDIALFCQGYPSVEIQVSTRATEALAETIRNVTAIDVCTDAEAFTRVLAQIALIAHRGGPEVRSSPATTKLITPLAEIICTDFAIACAVAFARFHEYYIDRAMIPIDEISIALVMMDQDVLAYIFGESFVLPGATGPGRHAKPVYDAEQEEDRLLLSFGDGRADADRRLWALTYWHLLSVAEIEGWSATEVLMSIDEYLAPHNADQEAQGLVRFLEASLADVSQIRRPIPRNARRELRASSYWNLRSVAAVQQWSADVILKLINEHLNPTLDPDFVHYSNNGSGRDWKLLHDWLFWPDGNILWSSGEAGSSHGSYRPCSAGCPSRRLTCFRLPVI